jgi:hypothetical protein
MGPANVIRMELVWPLALHAVATAEAIVIVEGPVTRKSLPLAAMVLQNTGSLSCKSINDGMHKG